NWAQLKNELDSSKWNAAVQEWDAKRRKVLLDRRAQLKAAHRVICWVKWGKPEAATHSAIRIRLFARRSGGSHFLELAC
ncbi:hypothetical protein, partial [Burkholderia pseudomallei]|uniref:hypothetical protein n=1 Tax=Burkholderia pseudomallei TaxID=28450 RepID=UPI0019D6FEBD